MAPLVSQPETTGDPLATLLAEVANDGSVAVLVKTLATTLGQSQDTTWDALGEAQAAGVVERWPDHPAGPAVCLSALSVERLGLKATSDGSRWIRVGEPDPTERKLRYVAEGEPGGAFDADELGFTPVEGLDALVAEEERQEARIEALEANAKPRPKSPRRTVAELCEAVQTTILDDAELSAKIDRLPSLLYFEGFGQSWPIKLADDGSCGVCHGRALRHRACCLWCLRSGLDHLIPPIPQRTIKRKATAQQPTTPRRPVQLKGGRS